MGRGEGGNGEISSVAKTNKGGVKRDGKKMESYPKKLPDETNTKQILCFGVLFDVLKSFGLSRVRPVHGDRTQHLQAQLDLPEQQETERVPQKIVHV